MSDATVEMDEPGIVVSCDSHAGPKLVEQLRAYCPQQYLEQFDAFMSAALALICDADGDDVRGHLPQFCRRRVISAQLEKISCVRAHSGPH